MATLPGASVWLKHGLGQMRLPLLLIQRWREIGGKVTTIFQMRQKKGEKMLLVLVKFAERALLSLCAE